MLLVPRKVGRYEQPQPDREIESDSEEEKNVAKDNPVIVDADDSAIVTTNEGEDEFEDEARERCCNPFDHVDINGTKYFDVVQVLSMGFTMHKL